MNVKSAEIYVLNQILVHLLLRPRNMRDAWSRDVVRNAIVGELAEEFLCFLATKGDK